MFSHVYLTSYKSMMSIKENDSFIILLLNIYDKNNLINNNLKKIKN
jgi:hypothetical protein